MFAALFLPVVVLGVIGLIRFGISLWNSSPSPPTRSGNDMTLAKRWRLAGVCILAAGLLAAALAYRNAPAEEDYGAVGYEIDGGTASPTLAGDSKSYDRQMEGVGGQATVLADEIAGWWHGRKLAYTLALLSLAGFLGCFFIAQLHVHRPPPDHP
jgi:hypothetical protein